MRILILYAAYGGGHGTAAKALQERFEIDYPKAEIQLIDAVEFASPVLNKVYKEGYVHITRATPRLWGKIYFSADHETGLKGMAVGINRILAVKYSTLLKGFKPDVVVATHPFGVDMLANYKRKRINSWNKIKIGMVLTDYAPHEIWFGSKEAVDLFFVAHEGMKPEMIRRGIDGGKIHATGIPVFTRFQKRYSKKDLFNALGFSMNQPTVLYFPGGEYGLNSGVKTFTDLLELDLDLQIIAITGKNKRTKIKFEQLSAGTNKKICILGYTDRVAEFMQSADVVVSKPGGLTTTECIVSNVPMVAVSPIPGQEEQNAGYLVNSGQGLWAHKGENPADLVKWLLECPLKMEQIKAMQQYMARPDAAREICRVLMCDSDYCSE
jgi:processive 1,2-diacylglycerol beta-glucosyltransferase